MDTHTSYIYSLQKKNQVLSLPSTGLRVAVMKDAHSVVCVCVWFQLLVVTAFSASENKDLA